MDSQLIIELARNAKWFVYAVGLLSLVVVGQIFNSFIPLIIKKFFNANGEGVVKECSKGVEENLLAMSQVLSRLTDRSEEDARKWERISEVMDRQTLIIDGLAQGHNDFQKLWQDFIVGRQKLVLQVDDVHRKVARGG